MAKTRVSELAKKYGIKSADAVKMLNDIGEFVKTASSSIELPAEKSSSQAASSRSRADARLVARSGACVFTITRVPDRSV